MNHVLEYPYRFFLIITIAFSPPLFVYSQEVTEQPVGEVEVLILQEPAIINETPPVEILVVEATLENTDEEEVVELPAEVEVLEVESEQAEEVVIETSEDETPIQEEIDTSVIEEIADLIIETDDLEDLLDTDHVLDAQKDFTEVVRQSQAYTCGPASLATLLVSIGYATSEAEVLEYIEVLDENKGVTLWSLYSAAQKLGHTPGIYSIDADSLRALVIETGNPVLIHDEKEGVGGHFSVVRSFEGDKVQLADTEAGNIEYSFEDFKTIFKGSVLVIHEEGESFDYPVISQEVAETIWGMYVPVSDAAGEFEGTRVAILTFQKCQTTADTTWGDNLLKKHLARTQCYNNFVSSLGGILSADELAELGGMVGPDTKGYGYAELGEYSEKLYKEYLAAEAAYMKANSSKAATLAKLKYEISQLDKGILSANGEIRSLQQKLGEYDKAISAQSVTLNALSKKLTTMLSSSSSREAAVKRDIASAENNIRIYKSKIDELESKLKKLQSGMSIVSQYKTFRSAADRAYANYKKFRSSDKKKASGYHSEYKKYKALADNAEDLAEQIEDAIDNIEDDIDDYEDKIDDLEDKIKGYKASTQVNPNLAKEVNSAMASISANLKKKQAAESEIKRKQTVATSQQKQVADLRKKVEGYDQNLAMLKDKMYDLKAELDAEKNFVLARENEAIDRLNEIQEQKELAEGAQDAGYLMMSGWWSSLPGVGEAYDTATLLAGRDPLTNEQLTPLTKLFTIIGLTSGVGSGALARQAGNKMLEGVSEELGVSLGVVVKAGDKVAGDLGLKSVQDIFNLKDRNLEVIKTKILRYIDEFVRQDAAQKMLSGSLTQKDVMALLKSSEESRTGLKGHTYSQHINISDKELRDRVTSGAESVASKYMSEDEAARALQQWFVSAKNDPYYVQMMQNILQGRTSKFDSTYSIEGLLGKGYEKNANGEVALTESFNKIYTVIQGDGSGGVYIITSYPKK